MVIYKLKYKKDKVIVIYHLKRPYGESDIYDIIEVFYDKIESLNEAPRNPGHGGSLSLGYETQEVCVPKVQKRICFMFQEVKANSWQNDEYIFGPFIGSYPKRVRELVRSCKKCNRTIKYKDYYQKNSSLTEDEIKKIWLDFKTKITCNGCEAFRKNLTLFNRISYRIKIFWRRKSYKRKRKRKKKA